MNKFEKDFDIISYTHYDVLLWLRTSFSYIYTKKKVTQFPYISNITLLGFKSKRERNKRKK